MLISTHTLYSPPSPQVLKAIRAELKRRRLSPADRRLASVVSELALEPIGLPGFNQGIFYAPEALPARVAALAPTLAARSRPTTGTLRLLVLLVDFSDNAGRREPQDFRNMLFSQATSPTGSMRDFYKATSYSQLDVEGEVVGWLRLPQPYATYVDGQSGTGPYPHNAQKMVEDALQLVAAQVDFQNFDARISVQPRRVLPYRERYIIAAVSYGSKRFYSIAGLFLRNERALPEVRVCEII